jgi:hypothetical protein
MGTSQISQETKIFHNFSWQNSKKNISELKKIGDYWRFFYFLSTKRGGEIFYFF